MRRAFAIPILLAAASPLAAQTVRSPLVPRGSLFFSSAPSGTTVDGTYTDGSGTSPLGAGFSVPSLRADRVPGLTDLQDRFQALADSPGAPTINLGATTARFSADERTLPLQISYGILDRLTVGVTVPFLRKRMEGLVRLTPDGANVGRSPPAAGARGVSAFLGVAGTALTSLQTAVDETCDALGEQDPECAGGRALVNTANGFLADLQSAYQEEALFPLQGSELGSGIRNRWSGITAQFSGWDVDVPMAEVPLSQTPIDQATFESQVLGPAWPPSGMPLVIPDVLLGVGDVEVHAAIGLLQRGATDGVPTSDIQVHAAAVGVARFGTGTPDSLRLVAPIDPPRGVSGFELRVVADVLLPGRFAVLGVLEGGWNGTREMALIAPDAENLFVPGFTRALVEWSPGAHIRATVAPRFRLGPGLSVGGGWYFLRRDADAYELVDSPGSGSPSLPDATDPYTLQSVGFELRYVAMRPPIASTLSFPFEVGLRLSRSVAGSAGAPVQSSADALIRFRAWEW